MSLLPLRQLLYGSCDGGINVYNRDPALDNLMALAGQVIKSSLLCISINSFLET